MIRQLQSFMSGPAVPVVAVWVVMLTMLCMPVYPFLTTWLGDLFGAPLAWKAVKDVLLAAAALILVAWLLVDAGRRSAISKDKLIWSGAAFILISAAVTLIVTDSLSQQLLAGITMNGRYLGIFFIGYLALRYGGVRMRRIRTASPLLAWIGVGLALLGILQVFVLPLDTLERFGYGKGSTIAPYVLIDDDPDAPRAFATLRGPNGYGAFLVMTTIAAAVLSMRNKRWALGIFVMVVALVLSSSRSAWLALFVSFGLLSAITYSHASRRVRHRIVAAVSVVSVAGVLLIAAATTIPALRLAVFHSSPDDSHLTEGSTDDHWRATMSGIERVAEQPFGCGVGCAGPASFYGDEPRIAENYFIQLAEEAGIIGLLIWLMLFGNVMRRLWLKRANELALVLFAAGVGLTVIGVWLHVWVDDPVSLVWWGLAGMVLGMQSSGTRSKKQVD